MDSGETRKAGRLRIKITIKRKRQTYMRLSLLKHPLAVLRITLKLTQKEMADICEVSWSTIQAIEHGILRMSEAVAERLSIKADVSIDWLLKGDPEAPMVSQNGEPYTKRHFEEA